MGLFDSIFFYCECGEKIEAQSKSGDCSLARYYSFTVPADVAEDANRHAPFICNKCGKKWRLEPAAEPPKTVCLIPREIGWLESKVEK